MLLGFNIRGKGFMNNQFNGYDYLLKFYDDNSDFFRFCGDDKKSYFNWRDEARSVLKDCLGINFMRTAEFECEYAGEKNYDGYTREKIIINTQPYLRMPVYILKPNKANSKALVAVAGHGCYGKEGLTEPWENENTKKYNHIYAIELVKKGYTVFVPDMIGTGERKLDSENGIKEDCAAINNVCTALGISIQGINVFDLERLVDFIKAEYDFISLGTIGFSAGGNAVLLLSALDDRIEYTAVSGYFHSYRDVMFFSNKCGCNFVPNLWQRLDMCDIAAMVAPKPLFFETGSEDNINGKRHMTGVYEQLAITKRAYSVFGKEPEIKVIEGGKHRWYGYAIDFVDRVSKK